ncbi:penicillin acylase family protein [Lysobacter cavernae]|uniref:Penicillin acylase family protein n=1 Tax=Lysobacter cavernae TaxID=1685901 RepID=A0ABV7RM68_9GAMM
MKKWIKRGLIALAVALMAVIAVGWWAMRGSLPPLDGQYAVRGLSVPATVQRDALGVVTIDAGSEADAMRALGYVHAQERFFEMDLLRRTAAGELAALFGKAAVDLDKQHRVHRLRARIEADPQAILGPHRAMAQAYVDGVNAGLASLKVRPWPYLLLRTQPQPWRLSDSALTGYAMYFDLQDGGNRRELAMARLRPQVPAALYALLAHDGSSWDAPLMGTARGDAVLPDAAAVDLRRLPMPKDEGAAVPERNEVGSNNFAVDGTLTADGRAIVADDMHLGLRAPNLWFRARLRYPDARAVGGRVDATGATLPGLPALVVGSNGQVAWGFTNSYGDWLDWQRQPACAKAPCAGRKVIVERIDVAGGKPVDFDVEETAWGPIMAHERDGTALALRWVAHQPGSLTLGLADFLHAHSLDDALAIADHTAIPGQNLLIGDRNGRIAWRLLGPVPQRQASCAASTVMAAGTCPPWSITAASGVGLPAGSLPRLWTANSRVVDGELLAKVGDGGYANGARAGLIRDGLMARDRFSERDLLAIQLDDRALFLQRWWQLLRERDRAATTPALHALAAAASQWQGRASTDSVSYRVVRAWRLAVHDRLLQGLTAPAQAALDDDFEMPNLGHFEGAAWPLVTQRPAHLLPRRFATWEALFEDAAIEVRNELRENGLLSARSWGERNTARICHPLSRALPGIAKPLLCMKAEPLPGDSGMPRVQGPDFGASERMVVSPGHEAEGLFHMPGGQSGHPMSPHWGAGHDDWVQGRPTPFLPGASQHTLQLQPAPQ